MGGGAAGDAEALDDALEALALGDPDHVDQLALLEGGDRHHVAHLEGRGPREADLGEDAGRQVDAGLLRVRELGLAGVLGLLAREADLHGVVSVGLDRLHLHHGAGAGFNH